LSLRRSARSRIDAATNKENAMLRKFAAALIATTLVAGAAFAAEPSGTAGATPAAASANVKAATAAPAKTVKHAQRSVRKHHARGKIGTMHQAHHVKSAKTHQAGIKSVKSAKHIDGGRPRA
jgi:hypothetical protein